MLFVMLLFLNSFKVTLLEQSMDTIQEETTELQSQEQQVTFHLTARIKYYCQHSAGTIVN